MNIRTAILIPFVIALSIAFSLCLERGALFFGHASADPLPLVIDAGAIGVQSDAGAQLPQVGSGSALASPVAATGSDAASKLADPITQPGQAITQLENAKTNGWPLALLAALVLLFHGLAYVSSAKWIAWLAVASRASYISIGVTLASAAYNALAAGGTWLAVGSAVAAALFLLKNAKAPTPPPAITALK